MGRSEDNTSESEDWGDDGWTVECPCGINFDDGEEMVECDACRVWVHTRCCRVPKGLTHYICERCREKQHNKQVREEVEVAALLADLPSARSTPFDEASRSPFFSNSSLSYPDSGLLSLTEGTLTLQSQHPLDEEPPYDIPLSQRVHTHGVTGGEEQALSGAPSFSRHLWRHQLMVPKPLELQGAELPLHLLLDMDPPDLHGADPDQSRHMRNQDRHPLRRGAQAKAERRKRLMDVVDRYEQRRRRRSEEERKNRAQLRTEEAILDERSRSCTSWQGQAQARSRGKFQVESVPVANGNACASGSSDLTSPGGTTSWTGGYVPRNPYALKKAAVLEYMQTSQSRCASCESSESLSWHEVKGLEGSVCDTCAARHKEQKFCPHCVHIYQREEEREADPRLWLVCTTCSRLVHKECQAKKPLNGTGPVKRSTFLCSGCMREKKKSRQEKEVGKASFVGVEMGVDLARATVKSAAVLRTEDQSSAQVGHVNGYDIPGVGLEDECSRPGGDFDGFREVPSGAVTALEHVEGLKAPMLRLSIKNGIREEDAGGLASMQVKDGLYAQRLQLVNECYPSSPKAKKAAAIAMAEKIAAEEAARTTEKGSGKQGTQETEETAGVPTPSGPEPELQRRESDPGSTSVKNGDGRASGGEGTVDSGSRKQDMLLSPLSSSPLANKDSALLPPNALEKPARPGSPSPSSSSNSSFSQARDSAPPPPSEDPVQIAEVTLTDLPPGDPAAKATTSPWSHSSKPKLHHALSVPSRPKALSLPTHGKKLLDFPDTPGSVTSEHKPSSKLPQGVARPVHLAPSGRLVSSRPSHPTGMRLHSSDGGRPSLRHPFTNGYKTPPLRKEVAAAMAVPKSGAEMPPPPPPVAPKRPPGRSGSDLPPMNDEELALLLHQELNSSPRMPRVSRSKKPGANGVVPPKRSNSLLATTPLKRSRSGDGTEGPHERKSGSKQESDETEHGAGEVESAGEKQRRPSGAERKVKLEAEVESDELPMKLGGMNGVRSLPVLIEELGLVSEGSLEHVVDAVSKHWHTLRKPGGEPYPPLQRQAILEALSGREEWAHLVKQGLPTKRKRTFPSVLSDSEGEEDLKPTRMNGYPQSEKEARTPPEEESMEGVARIARRKRSRRAVAELSDTSEAEEGAAPKPARQPPPHSNGGHPLSPTGDGSSLKPSAQLPANGNGTHSAPTRPQANGHSHPPPGGSSSSGPSSQSSAEEEEAVSRRQGPPRRKRSRIDARSLEVGARRSGGSGTPEDES